MSPQVRRCALYTAADLQRAMQVVLARMELRWLRARPAQPLTDADRQQAARAQGRCGRDYALTDSGCILPS